MLKLSSITKSFGPNKVLDGLTLSFEKGITGIAGANGCGKTTMFRIITGLINSDAGSIEYCGEKINTSSVSWRAKTGYVPQTVGLYNRMKVRDLLDYMLALSRIKDKRDRKNRIEYYAEELNLGDYLNTYCGHLSGGVRQRVAIAQGLIHGPEILFLDEPTNNLDIEERERFHRLLDKIKNEKTILYIGHILSELGSISDRVIILRNGKRAFEGPPPEHIEDVYKNIARG